MYQALYRKYRPKTFDEVVGQEHITDILRKQVLTDRPSHAYLFTGTRGTGKTTCAKLLSRAVNCLNPVGGNPCGECQICRGIENGSILDVTEMDAASNNGVDDVRAIRDEAVYAPVAAKRRVYIIDEVHMLSKPAFNALLKIMEEPPEHLIFILATTELYKVPATILSRCQRYSFRRVPAPLIRDRLMQVAAAEGMELTEDAAGLLSRLADGALRDALSLLDQCAGAKIDRERVLSAIGLAENDEICRMMDAVLSGDGEAALNGLDGLYRGGKDVSAVLNQLSALCRDILLGRVAPRNGVSLMNGGFSEEYLHRLADLADTETLLRDLDILQSASAQLDKSSDRKLCAELCLLRMANPAAFAAPAAPAPRPVKQEEPKKAAAPAPEPKKALEPEKPAAPVKPEKTPEPVPVPEPVKAPQSAAAPVSWEAVLRKLEETMFIADYMLVSNPDNLSGEMKDGTLILYTKNETIKGLLDTRRLEEIRSAAAAVAGGNVPVKAEPWKAQPDDRFAALDALMDRFK